jgi:hypothetical protein
VSLRIAASIGACFALVFACSSDDSQGTAGLGLSDLVGDWDNGELLMQIADDGSYQVLGNSDSYPAGPLMGGFVAREGKDLNFVTDLFGDCAGMVGVYSALIDNDTLALTLVEDPCAFRAASFTQVWDDVG